MSRFDLAHVDPRETGFDALGKGIEEGRPAEAPVASKYLSRGLTRSRTDKLVVMPGGADARATGTEQRGSGGGGSNVTSLASAGARAGGTEGSAALKAETHLSPALEQLPWTAPTKAPDTRAQVAERRAEAKARGYEGEACPECMNFTLVRNGTCMKCDTCGSTTGCS
jgi:ribonucleoside-diphosphate reductase alpha chain